MELKWSWVVIVGLVALVVIVVAAFLWPLRRQPRRLRPLAWVGRLTLLPEYARAYRRYRMLLAAIAMSTVAVLLCAMVATARPVSSQAATAEVNRAHPEDVMLCLQDDPASHDASVVLSYFRDRVATFDTLRFGLTSRTLRVIPLTRDYPFLRETLGRYADLQRLQSTENPSPEDAAAVSRARDEFARSVNYSDYQLTVNDALAMCLKGFPDAEKPSDARRSVIYVGPGGEAEEPIYSDEALTTLARSSGIQVNVLTRTPLEASGVLSAIATATDGRFISYVGDTPPDAQAAADDALRQHLDDIRSHPPVATASDGTILVEQVRDRPDLVLTVGLVLAIIFAISLAGVRR